MAERVLATDLNEPAWDPERDPAGERRSLLRELDPLPDGMAWATFVPKVRTRHGLPLGERARLLLLGSTTEDLETIANQVNLAAEVDDDDEAATLAEALRGYEALLGQYRLLRRDSDETTLARMPVADRRRARELQNRIRVLQALRYDWARLRLLDAEAAVARTEFLLAEARGAANTLQVDEYERLLGLHRARLDQLRAQ